MVNIQRKIRFINNCDCIVDYDLLERAILWYTKKPTISIKRISMHGRYPCVSIGKQKIHIHRLIGLYHYKITDTHYHHIDGNKLNVRLENIMPIKDSEHLSLHNKGKNRISEKQREAIVRFNHSRKGCRLPNRRKDITSEQVFRMKEKGFCFNEISKTLGVDWACIRQRYNDFIHDNKDLLTK